MLKLNTTTFKKLHSLVTSAIIRKGSNMSSYPGEVISIDKLKKFISDKSIVLIDVREKQEIVETGTLPNSINIPLGEIEKALQLSEVEFQSKYNVSKPQKHEPIVFSCKSGNRSAKALSSALNLGYTNSMNYGGGWTEWAKYLKET